MLQFDPGPADPRLYEHLEGYPRELFSDAFYRSCELVERYAQEWAIEIAGTLTILDTLAEPATSSALAAARTWEPAFVPALGWLLDRLAGDGFVLREVRADGTVVYTAAAALRAARRDELREAILELDPANAATLALLDLAAESYPAVAHGEVTGEEALFGHHHTELWRSYFDNRNRLYAINNEIAAIAAADRLPPGPFRILEIGAGGASGTAALLAELERRDRLGDLAGYRITDISPFLRRHGERTLRSRWPGLPLTFSTLDVDRPWAPQGVQPGSVQLVFGVNVLHVALELDATLAEAREAVAPGCWVVGGECVRPFPGQRVYPELVFQLLGGFTRVRVDPETRPLHGFLCVVEWRTSLARAGFSPVAITPDVERIREIYPRFFTAAVCGRRPDIAS